MVEMKLDIGTASRPCPGFAINGDAYVIKEILRGYLIAVFDGLGHGGPASEASSKAVECLQCWSGEPASFYTQCDAGLIRTRGVVAGISVVDFELEKIEFTGVGNIEANVYRDTKVETLISSNGIVGSGRIPRIHLRESPFPPNAILVMYSDGISSRFRLDDYYGLREQSAQFIADVVIRDWSRANDDATVVVVRRER